MIPEIIEYIWKLMERNKYLDKLMYWVECQVLDRIYSKRIWRHLQPALRDVRIGNFYHPSDDFYNNYDIDANLVCWRCANASIEGGRQYYGIKDPEIPKRPGCRHNSKLTEVWAWDIPDPGGPINEEGCKFVDVGYDIREVG